MRTDVLCFAAGNLEKKYISLMYKEKMEKMEYYYKKLVENVEDIIILWNNEKKNHNVDNQAKIDYILKKLIDRVKDVNETTIYYLKEICIPPIISLIFFYEREKEEEEEEEDTYDKEKFIEKYERIKRNFDRYDKLKFKADAAVIGGRRKTRRHRHKKSSPKRKSIHRRRRHRKTRQRK